MATRYRITLTEAERKQLRTYTRSGKTNAPKFIHARALLLCDVSAHAEESWKVADVATALGVSARTIEHLKQRFVEEGLPSDSIFTTPQNTAVGSTSRKLNSASCKASA